MSATFYSQAAEEAAAKVLDAFRSPETLPKALATIALPTCETHASGYSLRNQLIVWLFGYSDAAGFKQWRKYGRQVRKGEKAFPVLAPVTASFMKWDEEQQKDVRVTYVKGWKHVKVFGVEQTDIIDEEKWQRYNDAAQSNEEFLSTLPWTEVARAWDLATTADGNLAQYGVHGCYRHGVSVEVAVENLSTWAHEIIHAADDRCGTLTQAWGQQPDNEIVAEVGGAVLCIVAGHEDAADLGGCYEYCNKYLGDAKDPVQAAGKLIDRICAAVNLVMVQAQTPDTVIERAA
jgi:hypothetical protein